MTTIKKIALIALTPLLGLGLAALCVSAIMSPPWAGGDIAAKNNLPHHAAAAHRGASYFAPENTYEAFIIASALGADYLECDVQRSADGTLIIFHDDTPERTTDAARVFPGRDKKPVGSFTWRELQQLDAGSWFNAKNPDRARPSYKGIKICSFEKYIDAAEATANHPGLLIELKSPSHYPGIEGEVIAALKKRGRVMAVSRDGTMTLPRHKPDMLMSFDRESVARCAVLAPEIPRTYLVAEKGDPDSKWDDRGWRGFLDDAAAMKAQIGPVGYLAWPWYTGKAHRQKLMVIMWTIDREWQQWMVNFFGIDWIITNRIDRALTFYGRKPKASLEDIFLRYKL